MLQGGFWGDTTLQQPNAVEGELNSQKKDTQSLENYGG